MIFMFRIVMSNFATLTIFFVIFSKTNELICVAFSTYCCSIFSFSSSMIKRIRFWNSFEHRCWKTWNEIANWKSIWLNVSSKTCRIVVWTQNLISNWRSILRWFVTRTTILKNLIENQTRFIEFNISYLFMHFFVWKRVHDS